MQRILRLPELIETVGLQKAAIYSAIKAGDFPKPIKLTKRAVGWRTEDVQQWLEGRKAA
ncbi:MAG: AlpA family phage regulatory protein [Boseongicola sp. SB0677_bin_26]|nr:AlpA family phage regulatory protein [Boseongicola sp. SB0677_bin_26]